MLDMTIRATALAATLEVLQAGFEDGRSADEPLQVELLKIAREQAASLTDHEVGYVGCQHTSTMPPAAVACGVVIPFRRQAKMSTSSSASI